jgi:hypothetical protein
MWRFRINRPFLLWMIVLDVIFAVTMFALAMLHVRMGFWISNIVTCNVIANIIALWRDGVS